LTAVHNNNKVYSLVFSCLLTKIIILTSIVSEYDTPFTITKSHNNYVLAVHWITGRIIMGP